LQVPVFSSRCSCVLIAEFMGVSQKTIDTYKSRLMKKSGVRTTTELMARMQAPANEQLDRHAPV